MITNIKNIKFSYCNKTVNTLANKIARKPHNVFCNRYDLFELIYFLSSLLLNLINKYFAYEKRKIGKISSKSMTKAQEFPLWKRVLIF